METLIFIPTYNEAENIGNLIEQLQDLKLDLDILIVDDESKDDTIEIIKRKQQKYDNIHLIVRKGKKGRGLAGRVAFQYFSNSKYDILVEMDADLSHNPKYIPKILNEFPEYDVVIGSRLIAGGGEEGRSIYRRFITIISNLLIKILFRTSIKDCTSGLRAFKKQVVNKFDLNHFFSTQVSIVEEILYACILLDVKIKEIPITFYERSTGTSKLNLKRILKTLLAIFKIINRNKKIINWQNF